MKKRSIKQVLAVILLALMVSGAAPGLTFLNTGVVVAQAAARVSLSTTKTYLIKGKTKTLKLKNAKGTIKWSSNKKNIATVSGSGKVKAVKKGTAVITATYKNKKYKCTVIVETPKLSAAKVTLTRGKTRTISLKGTKQKVTWKSNKTSVATVTSKGKITAKKAGTAKITATAGGKSYTCTVTVKNASSGSTTSKLAANYTKVKNYIQKKGQVFTDGNRVLYYEQQIDGMEYGWMIEYNAAKDKLVFVETVNSVTDDDVIMGVSMDVNVVKSQTVSPYVLVSINDYTGLETRSSFKASSYTGAKNIKFNILSNAASYTQSDAQALSNALMTTGFAGWNAILKSYVGISVKNLGFTAYAG